MRTRARSFFFLFSSCAFLFIVTIVGGCCRGALLASLAAAPYGDASLIALANRERIQAQTAVFFCDIIFFLVFLAKEKKNTTLCYQYL